MASGRGDLGSARGAVQHASDRAGAAQRDGVRDGAGARGVSRPGGSQRLPGAAPGEQQEPQPGHPDRRAAVGGVHHRRRRHRLPDRRRRLHRRDLPEPPRAVPRRLAAGAHRNRRAQPGAGAARLGRGRVSRSPGLPADPRLCGGGAVGLARRAALPRGRLGLHPGGRHPSDRRRARAAARRRGRRPCPQLRLRDAAPGAVHGRRLPGGGRGRRGFRNPRPRRGTSGRHPALHGDRDAVRDRRCRRRPRRGCRQLRASDRVDHRLQPSGCRSVAGGVHLALPRRDAERGQAAPHQRPAAFRRRCQLYPAPRPALRRQPHRGGVPLPGRGFSRSGLHGAGGVQRRGRRVGVRRLGGAAAPRRRARGQRAPAGGPGLGPLRGGAPAPRVRRVRPPAAARQRRAPHPGGRRLLREDAVPVRRRPPHRHRIPSRLLRLPVGGVARALPRLPHQSAAHLARRLRAAPAHHARRPRTDPGARTRRAHLPRVLRRPLGVRRRAHPRRTVPAQGVLPPLRRLLLVRHGRAGGACGAGPRPAVRRRRRGAGRDGHPRLLRRARQVAAGDPLPHLPRGPRRAGRHLRHLLRPGPHRHGAAGRGAVLVPALRRAAAAPRQRAAGKLDRRGARLPRPHHGAVPGRRRAGPHRRHQRRTGRAPHPAPLLGALALDRAPDPRRRHPLHQTERARRHQLHLPDLGLRARRTPPR